MPTFIGDFLTHAREKRGILQRVAAERIGRSTTLLSAIEVGRYYKGREKLPSVEIVRELCELYEIDETYPLDLLEISKSSLKVQWNGCPFRRRLMLYQLYQGMTDSDLQHLVSVGLSYSREEA